MVDQIFEESEIQKIQELSNLLRSEERRVG